MGFAVKGAETDDELKMANDIMAKVHAGNDFFKHARWLETCGSTYPGFRREHTRIAIMKSSEIAGALRLTTETIRIGEARLKMGGFGWVATAPDFRNKGVSRSLMQDTLQYMAKHKYHVSMLFGIPNYYHRFGFTTTLADYDIILDADEIQTVPTTLIMRTAKPGDIQAIRKIHDASDVKLACSLLRSSAHMTNKWENFQHIRVLTNDQGKVEAYIFARRKENYLSVDELGVTDTNSCMAVLNSCSKIMREEAVAQCKFLVPPTHPFARFLLKFKSTHEMHIHRDSGGMMAIIDTAEALQHMIPEWESLLMRSVARNYRTHFTLLIDKEHLFRVRANKGAIDVSQTNGKNKFSISKPELINITTGHAYIQDLLNQKRRSIQSEATELICAIFPKRNPYVWPLDRF